MLNSKIEDLTFVAFDTETTGAYPLGSEIVEFGAIKFKVEFEKYLSPELAPANPKLNWQILDELQVLVKPSRRMSAFNISIHGITNEMVSDCSPMSQKINQIREFLNDCILIAHHAPFDMGFLIIELEKANLKFPTDPVLCTSLLGRALISETPNHKLQTLVKYFKLDGGNAHRALDDAKACGQVALECFRRLGPNSKLQDLVSKMKSELRWSDFQMLSTDSELIKKVAQAILDRKDIQMIYSGGTRSGSYRIVTPKGIVRNPDGDYISAICHIDRVQKRFYFNKIKELLVVDSLGIFGQDEA